MLIFTYIYLHPLIGRRQISIKRTSTHIINVCIEIYSGQTGYRIRIIYKRVHRVHRASTLGGTHSWIFLRVVEYGTYCCELPLTLIWCTSARNFLGSGGCVVGGSSVIQCNQRCLSNGQKKRNIIL